MLIASVSDVTYERVDAIYFLYFFISPYIQRVRPFYRFLNHARLSVWFLLMYIEKPIALLRDGGLVFFPFHLGLILFSFVILGQILSVDFFQLFIERSKNNFWVANKLLVSLLTRKERTNNASSRVDGGTKFKFRWCRFFRIIRIR